MASIYGISQYKQFYCISPEHSMLTLFYSYFSRFSTTQEQCTGLFWTYILLISLEKVNNTCKQSPPHSAHARNLRPPARNRTLAFPPTVGRVMNVLGEQLIEFTTTWLTQCPVRSLPAVRVTRLCFLFQDLDMAVGPIVRRGRTKRSRACFS